jgi:arylsulfatase A-like enzyme
MAGQAPIHTHRPTPRNAAAFGLLAALTAAIALLCGLATPGAAHAQASGGPNIIVLLTDDQEPASLRIMKNVRKEMKRKGVTLKHFYANFPLCCPSRATMLTGQYAHNHHVLSNQEPEGGYGVFNELHGNNYLPLWLQGAGYSTAYIGKYLNEYAEPDDYGTTPTDVPRGWNEWRVLAPSRAQYFGYTLNQNGVLTQYSEDEEDYSTDVFTTKAKRYIRRTSKTQQPFFLMLGYAAPHGGGGGEPGRTCNRAAVPAPRDLGALRKRKKLPLPPSFNEADVSDKPGQIQQMEALTTGQISDITRKRRCAWESLLAVDDSVGEIVAEVKRDKIRSNTYIFFLSDNGYLRGEHRIRNQKRYLYEESARLPFVARGPGIARGEVSDDVTANADLVPTILELTGAQAGLQQDGRSLMPSFANPAGEAGRAILLEAYAGPQIMGLRTSRYTYTEWETDFPLFPDVELYDNYVDPYQLNNVAGSPAYAGVVGQLAGELDALADCQGAECYSAPTAEMSVTGAATGPKGCAVDPVIARVASPQEDRIASVSFRVQGVAAGDDVAAPYEIVLPSGPLHKALPKPAVVEAKVLYTDGRRIGLASKVLACR